jgi:hypothetical protein
MIQTGVVSGLILSGTVLANFSDRIAPANITFLSDWNIVMDGIVVSETELDVHYDASRLSRCRARDENGFDNWQMQAFVSVDGAPAMAFDLMGGQGTPYLFAQRTNFVVPKGKELSIWFKGSDVTGCVEWDSAYGQNYRFPIAQLQDIPLLSFHGDWTITQSGVIRAGQPLRLHYDLERATTCRAMGYLGTASWNVHAHVQVDGKAVELPILTYAKSWNLRGQQDVIFRVPEGRDMTIWFENESFEYYTGMSCRAFDSDYGRNYHFEVH